MFLFSPFFSTAMKLRQIFLLIIFFFPTFIYSLECGVGGICYGHEIIIGKYESHNKVEPPFKLGRKNCSDSCVSFKCFVDDGQIMEGAGCYEDFANTCKYTRTEIKDKIKESIRNNSLGEDLKIREADVYFTSCNDEDGCATNGFEPWAINDTMDESFGFFFYKEEKGLACNNDKKPMKYLETVNCSTLTNCESGREFQWNDYKHPNYGKNKICDACVKYTCTSDGKTVNNGYGCYEDFENACNFINSDVKEKVKRNIKDSFYFDKNYMVFTCSDSDNCQHQSEIYLYYNRVNRIAENSLIFDKNSMATCDKKTATTPQPVTTAPPQKTTSKAPNVTKSNDPENDQTDASNVFTTINPSAATTFASNPFAPFSAATLNALQKITIFGLIFVYLW